MIERKECSIAKTKIPRLSAFIRGSPKASVTASEAQRSVAVPSLARTLSRMRFVSEPEEIATSQKRAPRDDTG